MKRGAAPSNNSSIKDFLIPISKSKPQPQQQKRNNSIDLMDNEQDEDNDDDDKPQTISPYFKNTNPTFKKSKTIDLDDKEEEKEKEIQPITSIVKKDDTMTKQKPVSLRIARGKPISSIVNNVKIGDDNLSNTIPSFVPSRLAFNNDNKLTSTTTTTTTTTNSNINLNSNINTNNQIKPNFDDEFDLPNHISQFDEQQKKSITSSLNGYSKRSLLNKPSLNGQQFQYSNSNSIIKTSTTSTTTITSKTLTPKDIEISPLLSMEQKQIVELVMQGKSIFFTGSAGTGKSFVLREIVRILKLLYNDKVHVTASTGIAACNIGGTTLHSFAGIGLGDKSATEHIRSIENNLRVFNRWRTAKTLIIDEISMISSEFFDKLEEIAKKIRKSQKPFGGLQCILVGDFCQLPPISKPNKPNNQDYSGDISIISNLNRSPFCFNSNSWSFVVQESLLLKQVFRQKDNQFVTILNELRFGIVKDTTIQLLNKCTNNQLNQSDGIIPTILYPHRTSVDKENQARLNELQGDAITFDAVDEGNDYYKELLKNMQAPQQLTLKIGSQVILLKNLDFELELVNGARGVVVGWSDTDTLQPIVKFTSGVERVIGIEVWKIELGAITVASRRQLPLALAWAISIHKSQGMSIDKLIIDLNGTFENGQAYVALSRATSLQGLQLKSSIKPNHFKVDNSVVNFYKSIEDKDK